MIPSVAEQRDFAAMARFDRLALNARALEHDLKRNHEMAEFLVAGADAAAEVAQAHAEMAMFLLAVRRAP